MKSLVFIFFFLYSTFCFSQSIASAEYFFDTDPGVGNGTALNVNPNSGSGNQSYIIDTSNLPEGFHSLYIRVKDANNKWSHYDRSIFFIATLESGQNVVSAEYFFDIDPNVGNGTALTINNHSLSGSQNYLIPTTGLSNGFHSLYIRTQLADGSWSHYNRSIFYITTLESGQNIIGAEYFFDIDPKVGNGSALSISNQSLNGTENFTIPTTGLSNGFHSLHIRVQLADGTWSLYDRSIFYFSDNTSSSVSNGEYFIDSDPGFGSATGFTTSSSQELINFDTTGLSEGDHLFCVRVQNTNGTWSQSDCNIFTIDSSLGIENNLYSNIKLFPNPFSENLNIDFPNEYQIETISIFNSLGQEVFQTDNLKRSLNLKSLESGVYLLKVTSQKKTASFKIIKQ